MTTLIETHEPSGKSRRCDARCYNSRKTRCRCIYGGRNHGQGLEKAIRRTLGEAFPELKKAHPEEHPRLGREICEPALFDAPW